MITASYVGGGQALTVCFGLTCISVLLWRVTDGVVDSIRDITGGIFVAAYVPLLASFSSLLLFAPDGVKRVIVFIGVTICSDIGGFAVGVMAGKHPMSPSVSPKKSWEGAAGGLAGAVITGMILREAFFPHLFGRFEAASVAAVMGVLAQVSDLAESLVKRCFGVKDSSQLLPGHGGVLDRFDSFLLSTPFLYFYLTMIGRGM